MNSQTPQIYLISPIVTDAAAFSPLLEAALDTGAVACVLLRVSQRDPTEAKKILRALAPAVQQRGAALLIENDAQLAGRVGADGVHAAAPERVEEAIEAMKPDRIVGVGGLETRDACMVVGEMDIDYLMFGGPDEEHDPDDIFERARWWAEIFNVPCVAYAERLEEMQALAACGVEFVALEKAVWADSNGPAAAIAAARAALRFGGES